MLCDSLPQNMEHRQPLLLCWKEWLECNHFNSAGRIGSNAGCCRRPAVKFCEPGRRDIEKESERPGVFKQPCPKTLPLCGLGAPLRAASEGARRGIPRAVETLRPAT